MELVKVFNMKKIYGLALLAVTVMACEKKEDVVLNSTREVVVSSELTKTTIDYEGDLSHLVWTEGDSVMYLTDDAEGLRDYGFQSSVVSNDKFTASISASATKDNKMLVVYPSKTLSLGDSEATLKMDSEFKVSSKDSFDGRTLPMVALFNVPEGKEVSASYRPLGAVVRVAIDSTGHAGERVKSITLTTQQPCVGSFHVSASEKDGYSFSGSSNTVKVALTDTPELRNFKYVYIVVAKGDYTGVKMDIETELTTYSFADGKLNLSDENTGLFRVNVTLPDYEAPKEEAFVKVSSTADITDGSKYLMASKKSDTEYYVAYKKDYDYLRATTVSLDEKGNIQKTEATEKLAITFIAGSGDYQGKFALKFDALGKTCFVQSPTNVSAGVEYKGVFWFENESNYASQDNSWWTISVTDGKAVLKTKEFMLWGEPTGRFGEVTFFKDDGYFGVRAPETDAEQCADVVLFKLQ